MNKIVGIDFVGKNSIMWGGIGDEGKSVKNKKLFFFDQNSASCTTSAQE
jgi:hypothetical protein